MLNESRLPGSFWWDAVAAFTHIHNRSPSASIPAGKTPFELWSGSKPDVSHFRVFGCTSYVHVKKDKRPQLASHTEKCVFIGYPSNYKAWLFWNPVTKKEIVSNSAEFDERFFPGTSTKPIDWPVPSDAISEFPDPVDQVGAQDIVLFDPVEVVEVNALALALSLFFAFLSYLCSSSSFLGSPTSPTHFCFITTCFHLFVFSFVVTSHVCAAFWHIM